VVLERLKGQRPNSAEPESSEKSSEKRIGSSALAIIAMIRDNPQVAISEMATKLGLSERAVEKNLRSLREQNLIVRVGPPKGGYWDIP
jgi:DNA-binding IscR family transcriptional regulator